MTTFDFVDSLTADMLMSRLYLDEVYDGGAIPDDIYENWMSEFNLTTETERMLGVINNYLYINSPMRDPYLGLAAMGLSDNGSTRNLVEEQFGDLSSSEVMAMVHGLKLSYKLVRIAGLVQGLRAAYLTHFLDIVDNPDERLARKQQRGEDVTFSANGNNPSLIYMKSLYMQLKGYWAVALRPVDQDRLDNSCYLESDQWVLQIGRSFDEEFIQGPSGKIVFTESEVIPFPTRR